MFAAHLIKTRHGMLLLPPPMRTLCDHCGLSVFLSFVYSVCEQDYCKSNLPISLKLGVMIGPTNRKN